MTKAAAPKSIQFASNRSWNLRGDTMADATAFADQVTKIKTLGVDLMPEVTGCMDRLLTSDGEQQSVMAFATLSPQFMHVGRLCCLIRAVCTLTPAKDRELEMRVSNYTKAECRDAIDKLLPLFLFEWTSAYLGSGSIGNEFVTLSQAVLTGVGINLATDGSPDGEEPKDLPPNSSDSAQVPGTA